MSISLSNPFDSEASYRAALARADALFDAEPGTPEGDHLDALVTLIEAFEDRHYPMDLPDAIEAIPGSLSSAPWE